ncbi:MAG: AAA family ATPase [Oscillospiraceae bacterium]
MKIKLALADSNTEYGEKLLGILERRENFAVSMFTSPEALKESLIKQSYDIVLISPDIAGAPLNFKHASVVIVLSDSETDSLPGEGFHAINKYQRGTRLVNNILEIYSEYSPMRGSGNGRAAGNARIISVYSPAGGSGKTSVAIAIAELICNRGSKVLYINFEEFSSYGAYFKTEGNKNMGEIISGIEKRIDIGMKISSIARTADNGVMYFDEFENILDIYDISTDECEKLINEIAVSGACDFLIVDMGISFDERNRRMLDISDCNVIVTCGNDFAVRKIDRFLTQIIDISENNDKFCIVHNFGESGLNCRNLSEIGRIPYLKDHPGNKVIEYICMKSLINVDSLIR